MEKATGGPPTSGQGRREELWLVAKPRTAASSGQRGRKEQARPRPASGELDLQVVQEDGFAELKIQPESHL